MFRKSDTELNTTSTRDSWYKPNMLYNIHYKAPESFNEARDSTIYNRVGRPEDKRVAKIKKDATKKMRRNLKYTIKYDKLEYFNDDDGDYGYDGDDDGDDDDDIDDGFYGYKSEKECEDFIIPNRAENGVKDVKIEEDVENDNCGSAFGIFRVYCDSEIHVAWTREILDCAD